MNKKIMFASLFTVISFSQSLYAEDTKVESKLDVKELISLTPKDYELMDVCGVVSQKMDYKDSEGNVKSITFSRWGGGCNNG